MLNTCLSGNELCTIAPWLCGCFLGQCLVVNREMIGRYKTTTAFVAREVAKQRFISLYYRISMLS